MGNVVQAIILGIILGVGLQMFFESAWELYKISSSEHKGK